ncbi:hypothetical protein [Streptomonospora wellingtoniae]|uniref:Uncharacterized protein n=1 Tax=Streptomonospora wellingtoniae TaxID=3075544 RepID=A0ABU2KV53_9ACTN|nr:hypothetical protein [Streptomonospora sp. DSM 45055]MDT0302933.1 hypothetical protein [Streptomonospora sp. DSM 45055]
MSVKPVGMPADLALMRELAVRANRRGVEIDTTTNEERRRLVLRHPDLAARLCEQPLAFARPEQWTGYIAPALDQIGESMLARRNESPFRAQAAALYEEALRREGGAP